MNPNRVQNVFNLKCFHQFLYSIIFLSLFVFLLFLGLVLCSSAYQNQSPLVAHLENRPLSTNGAFLENNRKSGVENPSDSQIPLSRSYQSTGFGSSGYGTYQPMQMGSYPQSSQYGQYGGQYGQSSQMGRQFDPMMGGFGGMGGMNGMSGMGGMGAGGYPSYGGMGMGGYGAPYYPGFTYPGFDNRFLSLSPLGRYPFSPYGTNPYGGYPYGAMGGLGGGGAYPRGIAAGPYSSVLKLNQAVSSALASPPQAYKERLSAINSDKHSQENP